MKRLRSFFEAIFRHWRISTVSVLSLLSTTLTFLPGVHVPKLLPIGIALALIFVASYYVYSDQCDENARLKSEKSEIEKQLNISKTAESSLQNHLGEIQRINAALDNAKEHSDDESKKLRAELQKLRIKPYDEQKLNRAREVLKGLRHLERDLLRLILLNGNTRGDVIYLARTNTSMAVDINTLARPLVQNGLISQTHDHSVGYSTFAVNQTMSDVLKDLLFPRNEGEVPPFFNGI